MQRRRYSDEFKREAVQLTQDPGVTMAQIARDLGIGAGLLGRWVKEFREAGPSAFPGKGVPRDKELTDLKRELARVKKERDFLREAAGESTGACNTCFESTCRSFIVQGLPWALIQPESHLVQVCL